MADPRIPLKNRYLAAVLAYLVPGAGHLYQGRVFKGVLYLVCILGTFLFGLYLSQGKAVYYRMDPGNRNIAFFAQAGVGMFAIPAYVQANRFGAQEAKLKQKHQWNYLEDRRNVAADELPISAQFRGELNVPGEGSRQIAGQIKISQQAGEFGQEIRGTFSGQMTLEDGRSQSIEFELARQIKLDPIIGPGAGRTLDSEVVQVVDGNEIQIGWIEGVIPRSFANHFTAPLQDKDLGDMNRDLGKFFELAKIFTWIAGLLNILAVWDALEGPAYGYGDEEESTDEEKKDSTGEAAAEETESAQSEEVAQSADKAAAAEEPVV